MTDIRHNVLDFQAPKVTDQTRTWRQWEAWSLFNENSPHPLPCAPPERKKKRKSISEKEQVFAKPTKEISSAEEQQRE